VHIGKKKPYTVGHEGRTTVISLPFGYPTPTEMSAYENGIIIYAPPELDDPDTIIKKTEELMEFVRRRRIELKYKLNPDVYFDILQTIDFFYRDLHRDEELRVDYVVEKFRNHVSRIKSLDKKTTVELLNFFEKLGKVIFNEDRTKIRVVQ